MAATQYQIFIRFFNIKTNKALTNNLDIEWLSREQEISDNKNNKQQAQRNNKKIANGQMVEETLKIRINRMSGEIPTSTGYTPEQESSFTKVITDQMISSNPKYDMLFVYDGIATYTENDEKGTDKEIPTVLYERMKRIQEDPWFLYSIHGSLRSAMAKVEELADIVGKDNIKLGKVVPLDQYIDIV